MRSIFLHPIRLATGSLFLLAGAAAILFTRPPGAAYFFNSIHKTVVLLHNKLYLYIKLVNSQYCFFSGAFDILAIGSGAATEFFSDN